MINIALKGLHMDITPAIREYTENKVRMLEKFLHANEEDIYIEIELGKTTGHHQNGDIFRAEMTLIAPRITLRTEAQKVDLYAAIDAVKDELAEELKKQKNRKETLMRKGGRMIKDVMRRIGFSE